MVIKTLTYNNKEKKFEVIERELTEQEIAEREKYKAEFKKNERIIEIDQELAELNKDFIQELCGAVISNIEEKKARFRELHNEKRELLGLEPREYK